MFLLQTLTKVFISRILINFYNINYIKFFSSKKSSEAVASLPQWKLRHCTHSENKITYITLNHIYVDIQIY
jgi:hypothetical protein